MKDPNIIDFESRFPEKEKAISFINQLQLLDLSQYEIDDINNMIDDVFHMIPFGIAHIPKGTKLFRARKNNENQIFYNVSELGINKPENIIEYGRANKPQEPVFYCSTNVKLACAEVLQNLKKSFNPKKEIGLTTVSVWEVTKDLNLAPIYYSNPVVSVREDAKKYKEGNKNNIREKNIFNSDTLDVNDLILEFFCDEFSKPNINTHHDYKLSASYANRLRNANNLIAPQHSDKKFDGLVYPSVAMKYTGDNIALFENALINKIKFETAIQTICLDFDFDKPDFESYFTYEIESCDENGNLIWSTTPWRPR